MELFTKNPKAQKLLRAMWIEAFLIVGTLFITFFFYNYVLANTAAFSMSAIVAMTLKAVAFVMIGWSNLLSGISYYFDFLDHHLGHRKIMGVMGFVFAWAYTFALAISDPQFYFFGFFKNFTEPEIFLWTLGMLILVVIVIVSNTSLQIKMGYKNHRYLLRTTYIAYALFLWREILVDGPLWSIWLSGDQVSAPPLSLLIALYMCLVFLSRISMTITEYMRHGKVI